MKTLLYSAMALLAFGAGPDDITVMSYQSVQTSIHDLSNALGILTLGGEFATDQVFRSVNLEVAFFKNGKREPVVTTSTGLAVASTESGHTKGELSIKVIDLDYLPIKGAPDHAYRVHYGLATESNVAMGFRDISKDVFDVDHTTGSAVLRKGNSDILNPLFYLMGTRNTRVNGAADLDGLLRANESADIMVVHLTFSE